MASNNGYGDAIITTTDEEGVVHLFEKIQDIEVDNQAYALMVYLGKEDELDAEAIAARADEEGYDEEVVVMKVSLDEGVEVYEAVEDEDEFQKVVAYIEELMEDEEELVIDLEELLGGDEGSENN